MDEIPNESIRLIVTSPPYFNVKDYQIEGQIGKTEATYEEYLQRMVPVWKECFRVLKPNGKLVINSPIMPMKKSELNTHHNRDIFNINNDIERTIFEQTDFFLYGTVIWDKGSTDQLMMGSYPYPPNFYFLNTIEFINILVKDGKPEKIDKARKEASRLSREEWREYIATIWRFAPEKDRAHPAPYPLELPRRVIKLFSFVDDVILDPFMGSGTTALAAMETGRHFVGYEINPEYVSMAEQRIRNYRNETRQGDIFPEPTGGSQYPSTEVIHRLKNLNDSDYDALKQMLDEGYSIEEILFRSNRK
jgi:DNA modification methylase